MKVGNQMKKPFLIATALIACLVLGSISMAAAEKRGGKISVSSKVSLSYADPGSDPYGQSGFSGKVRAKKGCSVKRDVTVKGVGKTKTSKKGDFSLTSNSSVSGTYVAKVKKVTLDKGKARGKATIVCKAAESKSITVP